jgi:hypothetical protein
MSYDHISQGISAISGGTYVFEQLLMGFVHDVN